MAARRQERSLMASATLGTVLGALGWGFYMAIERWAGRERAVTGYVRGQPVTINVINIDGKPVEVATAAAFSRMRDAAGQAGVELSIVSGFRTMTEQQRLYDCYVTCSCNNCNYAARPGFSNHQSGRALDLNTHAPGVLAWLTSHGGEFGFRRTVAGEPWHWEYLD